jgi:cbb3-type cytochrome oxidase subunit 3
MKILSLLLFLFFLTVLTFALRRIERRRDRKT